MVKGKDLCDLLCYKSKMYALVTGDFEQTALDQLLCLWVDMWVWGIHRFGIKRLLLQQQHHLPTCPRCTYWPWSQSVTTFSVKNLDRWSTNSPVRRYLAAAHQTQAYSSIHCLSERSFGEWWMSRLPNVSQIQKKVQLLTFQNVLR